MARSSALGDHPPARAADRAAVRRPPEQAQVQTIIEEIGADEMLLFFDRLSALAFRGNRRHSRRAAGQSDAELLVDNALATYPRLNARRS